MHKKTRKIPGFFMHWLVVNYHLTEEANQHRPDG